jgi:hypothetical protein
MSKRLAILIGDFSGQDQTLSTILSEWSDAGILHSVACVDTAGVASPRAVRYTDGVDTKSRDFFDLLSSQIWDSISIVATRQTPVVELTSERIDSELKILSEVRSAFTAHSQLSLRSATVSFVDTAGLSAIAFNPVWDAHLLQEPVIRIDEAVAAQPLRDEMRAPLIALLAVAAAGGFVWQGGPLLGDLRDAATGNYKPLRIARAFLRVVNAGRLTDDVLSGAFPASGPWSVPPDVPNARAVPPSTLVPEAVVSDIANVSKFTYTRWRHTKSEVATNMGILEGIKLFFKEFIEALTSIPKDLVISIKAEAQDWVQNATFGKDSNVLLKFNPDDPNIDLNDVVDFVQSMGLSDSIEAIGDARPWELLQQTVLGLIDGGTLPNEVAVPKSGSNRLIFTEPKAIGPSPSVEAFLMSDFEMDLLGLEGEKLTIDAMDAKVIRRLDLRLAKAEAESRAQADDDIPASQSKSKISGSPTAAEDSVKTDEESKKSIFGLLSSIVRKKKSSRKERKLLKKANKGEATAVDPVPLPTTDIENDDSENSSEATVREVTSMSDEIGLDVLKEEGQTEIIEKLVADLAKSGLEPTEKLAELRSRFSKWRAEHSSSLLYRVAMKIVEETVAAERDLVSSIEFLATKPEVAEAQLNARKKFRKWTRRGGFVFVLLIVASVASIVFTPLPLLLLGGILASYGSGFVLKLVSLARDIVRARFKLSQASDAYDRAFEIGRNAANEAVRLVSVYEQYSDWQLIIRELIHIPFGREVAFAGAKIGVAEVRRPPAFILGQSQPDDSQKMRMYLNARSQTIHSGWLTEIMDVLKSEWAADYQNARLTGPGDNIHPEGDNAPSGSVVGKRPMSDEVVYYPRTDFRIQLLKGRLQKKLVDRKSQQIAADLGNTPINSLLGTVNVPGLGSALSGQTVEEFLAGLSKPSVDPIPYLSDIFSEKYPEYRISIPELTLPDYSQMSSALGHIQVQPGMEFTAAAWRIELSAPISPIEAFAGYEEPTATDQVVTISDEQIA